MFDNTDKPKGLKRLYLAATNSFRAFKWLVVNETAFKQEILLLGVSLPLVLLFNITTIERVVLILSLLFIILVEVINTAIEVVVDRVGLEIHPLSGLAKDLGSAAVLLSVTISIILWVTILI
jgi:diacylglycerol kinase (ATP)